MHTKSVIKPEVQRSLGGPSQYGLLLKMDLIETACM